MAAAGFYRAHGIVKVNDVVCACGECVNRKGPGTPTMVTSDPELAPRRCGLLNPHVRPSRPAPAVSCATWGESAGRVKGGPPASLRANP
jgi:hypothetical protein